MNASTQTDRVDKPVPAMRKIRPSGPESVNGKVAGRLGNKGRNQIIRRNDDACSINSGRLITRKKSKGFSGDQDEIHTRPASAHV